MRECFRIAAQHDVHVVQLAVHFDQRGCDGEIIVGGRALFLRPVFRIRHDEELVLEQAVRVVGGFLFGDELAEVTDDGAEIFSGGDHTPAADGVEPHRDRALGEQGGRVFADDGVGMIDAEDEKRLSVRRAAASLRADAPVANS